MDNAGNDSSLSASALRRLHFASDSTSVYNGVFGRIVLTRVQVFVDDDRDGGVVSVNEVNGGLMIHNERIEDMISERSLLNQRVLPILHA